MKIVTGSCNESGNFCNECGNGPHQADLQIQGKTIEPTQPYISIAKHFKMISEMSVNNLKQMEYTLGFGEDLDNFQSVK